MRKARGLLRIIIFAFSVITFLFFLEGCFRMTPLESNKMELENKLHNLRWIVYEPKESTPTEEGIVRDLEKIRNVGFGGIVIDENLLLEFDIKDALSGFDGVILEVSTDNASAAVSENVDGYLANEMDISLMSKLRKETSKPVSYRGNFSDYNYYKVDFVYAVEEDSLPANPYKAASDTASRYNVLVEETFKPVILEVKMPSQGDGFTQETQSRYYDLLYQSSVNFVWGRTFDKGNGFGLWQEDGSPKMIVRPKIFIQEITNGSSDTYNGDIKGYVMNIPLSELGNFAVACYAHRQDALFLQTKNNQATYKISADGQWEIPVEKGEEFVALLVNKDYCPPLWPSQIPVVDNLQVFSADAKHIYPPSAAGDFSTADIIPGYGLAKILLGEYGDKAFSQYRHLGGETLYEIVYTDGVISLENAVMTIAALDANGDETLDFPDIVVEIFVEYPYPGKTVGGNGIGSSQESIEDEFGVPEETWFYNGTNYLFYDTQGIVFGISSANNICSLIGVYFPVKNTDTSSLLRGER